MELTFNAEIRKVLGNKFRVQRSGYDNGPPWRTMILMKHPIRLFFGKLSRWREVAWSTDNVTILVFDESIGHVLEKKLPSKFIVKLC